MLTFRSAASSDIRMRPQVSYPCIAAPIAKAVGSHGLTVE